MHRVSLESGGSPTVAFWRGEEEGIGTAAGFCERIFATSRATCFWTISLRSALRALASRGLCVGWATSDSESDSESDSDELDFCWAVSRSAIVGSDFFAFFVGRVLGKPRRSGAFRAREGIAEHGESNRNAVTPSS